jgi:hypothetical protein
MNYQYVDPSNYDFNAYKGSVNDEPSKTVPDQTMSLMEILQRYASGETISVNQNLLYMDDEDLQTSSGINLKSLDLSEQHDLLNSFTNKIENQNISNQTSPNEVEVLSSEEQKPTVLPSE